MACRASPFERPGRRISGCPKGRLRGWRSSARRTRRRFAPDRLSAIACGCASDAPLSSCTTRARGKLFQRGSRAIVNLVLIWCSGVASEHRRMHLYPFPHPHPQAILEASDATVRTLGISRMKTSYLTNAGNAVLDGTLRDDSIHGLPTAEAADEPMRLRGIGRGALQTFCCAGLAVSATSLSLIPALRLTWRCSQETRESRPTPCSTVSAISAGCCTFISCWEGAPCELECVLGYCGDRPKVQDRRSRQLEFRSGTSARPNRARRYNSNSVQGLYGPRERR